MPDRSKSTAVLSFLKGERAVSPHPVRLVLIIYVLLLLSRLVDAAFLSGENKFLTTILLQLLIFCIPTYLYIRLRDGLTVKSIRLCPPRLSHLFLLLFGTVFLICACTLLAILCGMMNGQSAFTLYDTFVAPQDGNAAGLVQVILAYGILPAFCEELVFRGILCAEYESHGILYASAVSAVFFALLHFDLSALPVYLFAGFFLAIVLYLTRSVVAVMLVHLGYNLFGILAQAGLSGYCRSTGSIGLLIVLLIAFLLLSAALFCGEAARILKGRAKLSLFERASDQVTTPGLNHTPWRVFPRLFVSTFALPEGCLCILLWLGAVIHHIIVS